MLGYNMVWHNSRSDFTAPIIIFTNFLFKYILVGFTGLTLYPFIFIYEDEYKDMTPYMKATLINHELIHFEQQEKDGVVPFFFKYSKEYFKSKKEGKNHLEAYYEISYEKEAHQNQYNLEYLKK
jgi:hypothetical protein